MIDFIGILTHAWLTSHAPAHAPATPAFSLPTAVAQTTTTAQAAPLSADQVITNVQQKYSKIDQVTAKFRQSVHNATFGGADKVSDGQVRIKKPGKMRWDYLEMKKGAKEAIRKRTFLSNGSTLWVIENDNKQVMKKSLEQNLMPVAVTFLYGKGNLKDEFKAEIDTASGYGTKDEVVLKLTPKQPSAQYKNLYLVVSPKDFHVTQSVIIDSSGNSNRFQFFEPDFDTKIADGLFEFDRNSVKNYRFVDGDAQQPQQGSGATVPAPMPPDDVIIAPAPKK